MANIGYEIERLITFGLNNDLLGKYDVIPTRNALMDLLGLAEPYGNRVEYEGETVTEILENILDYAAHSGLLEANTISHRDAFAARIMGLLMPRQSEVIRRFYENYRHCPARATDNFYRLSRASNYIQVDRVSKNIQWLGHTEFGELEIAINLSKPEIDPRDIAAAKKTTQTNYPKCLICAENAGFAGTLTHPARQNHRIIPITLTGELWYFQYSPYVYYNEHCILLDEIHRPMEIRRETFCRLLDFLEQFPHYFIGSNTDLPIVGGSILSHEHYQGGRHAFPLERAKPYRRFSHKQFENISVRLVKWPLSVIRIAGENRNALIGLAVHILDSWRKYSDPSALILAETDGTPHNTVTPIARKNNDGLFELDIILRNNRTTPQRPFGLFHPPENRHHIKKENIGLIEVMGLAILPGRLKKEFEAICAVLQSGAPFEREAFEDASHELHKHLEWMAYLADKYGTANTPAQAEMIMKEETAKVFLQILDDAGLFKYNEQGIEHFCKFMRAVGFAE